MRSYFVFLLALFPRSFAERFGEDMLEQLDTDWRLARANGWGRAAMFLVGSTIDLVPAAVAERWSPSWFDQRHDATNTRGVVMMIGDWMEDLRQAARSLRRAPGFTAVAVGTLGVALGALAGVFAVVDAVLLDPLPYEDPDRLVAIAGSAPGSELPPQFPLSQEFYHQFSESDLLSVVAAYNSFTSTLRVGDRVERVRMSQPTPSFFEMLGVAPMLGRLPAPDEEDVTVLSHALWETWFAADPNVIGSTVYASGANRTVIGVMGPDFWFERDDVLLWSPFVFHLESENIQLGQFTGQTQLAARLAPGATIEALEQELDRLADGLPDRFGGSASYARMISQFRPVVRSLEQYVFTGLSTQIWILFGSVGLVLLIACANVANLFVVRSEDRARDRVVRRALGARKARLIGSSLAEAFVIAALAGVLAAVIARLGVPALLSAAPQVVPRLGRVGVGATTMLFTALAAGACALICGALPAMSASKADVSRLRDAGRNATGRAGWRRDGFVVLQTSLGLVLLVGSGLLFRSFQALRSVDPGYDVEDVYTFQLGVEEQPGLTDGPAFARFHTEFMERIQALPEVRSVGIIENVPLNEGLANGRYRTEERADDPEAGVLVSYTWAGGDYWGTMGISLLEGRTLTADDHVVGANNVVVSRTAADRLWPGESAVGRRVTSEATGVWYNVVGVVEDVLQYSFDGQPDPLVYLPLVGATSMSWRLTSPAYVVKSARAEEIGTDIRAIAREVAPTAPMYRTFTMAGLAEASMTPVTFMALSLGIASLLALLLGAVGLYGVLSYVVTQRTREIGVRMALGAEAARVRRMVVAQGARVVLLGVALGVPIAIAATRVLEGLLFEIEPADTTTIAAMSAGMMLVGLVASYLPARRASSVDPIESLKGT